MSLNVQVFIIQNFIIVVKLPLNLFYILGVSNLFDGRELDQKLKANLNRCLIPKNRIKLDMEIGKGFFGNVYKGQLTTLSGDLKTVAVKTIKGI